jgi:hypothetical protein
MWPTIMDAKYIAIAQQQLDETVVEIERAHGKRVTPAARIMLEALLLESITTRESEWRSRGNVLFEAYGADAKVSNVVRESFRVVLNQAYVDQTGDFITTRDLLTAIQKKWCDIFPIC